MFRRECISVRCLAIATMVTAATIAVAQDRRPGGAGPAFTVKQFKATNGQTLRYSLFVPADKQAEEKLPVVLCLHGRGGNTTAADILARADSQAKHRAIVMAPGISNSERWVATPNRETPRSVMPELIEALDSVLREHSGDVDRVYVTGQSMGGYGTWGLLASHPTKFAAAAPVCGAWADEDAPKMKNVPIWAFHGAEDPTVPVAGSQRMIEAIKKAGGEPRYTEYAGVGHNSWLRAYATAELWDWMFAQKRSAQAKP